MLIFNGTVESIDWLTGQIAMLKVHAPEISDKILPGQFCNIKVSDNHFPLLRRPFSVSDIDGEFIFFMFDIHGEGTKMLSEKKQGDKLDILGPLGNGFNLKTEYHTAVIVAGGIGAAPFPLLTKHLKNKKVISYLGARSSEMLVSYGLQNVIKSTDDGSEGFHGNILQLIESDGALLSADSPKIFACGPTPMLKAIQDYALKNNIPCDLSTECAMACGFGICQGCPVETVDGIYKLVCKDGPVFEASEVNL
ncbi:MAG: dihydroorotate oxidase [Melioribacteraceae bacterium]|nr:MAG: dihydroorotate oxidase [Melioribacteraceae bacterium]